MSRFNADIVSKIQSATLAASSKEQMSPYAGQMKSKRCRNRGSLKQQTKIVLHAWHIHKKITGIKKNQIKLKSWFLCLVSSFCSSTKLYYLVTEVQGHEQLAQHHYAVARQPGIECAGPGKYRKKSRTFQEAWESCYLLIASPRPYRLHHNATPLSSDKNYNNS